MHFEIENIGKVKQATLELRGITVLAGDNSTGKSTFGKALYCMFSAFRNSDEEIIKTRKQDIETLLARYFRPSFRMNNRMSNFVNEIWNRKDSPEELRDFVRTSIERQIFGPTSVMSNDVEVFLQKIDDYTKLTDQQIQKTILSRYLTTIFEDQVTHVNSNEAGKMSLSFKQGQFTLTASVGKSECLDYTDDAKIVNQIFYIDTPFVMDDSISFTHRSRFVKYHYRQKISRLIHYLNDEDNISEEVISRQKLKSVLDVINETVPGNFEKTESGSLGFREETLNQSLELANVSAGMKSFLIIKRLLEIGVIKERDILILDEPEIHLHPKWQIEFAKAIVQLQKEFDLTILLTTHSPYFLRAIQVYSIKEKIYKERCNFYHLTDGDKGYCNVQDCTNDTDDIFQTMAEPFQTLDNIYYDDNTE